MDELKRYTVPEGLERPGAVEELLGFLNNVPGLEPDGPLRVWNTSVVERQGRYFVLDGDQPMFVADTIGELHSFISGLAVATYNYLHWPIVAANLVQEEPSDTL